MRVRPAPARIFVTNDTNPPILLFLSAPCHPAVDANSGQEIGFFFADLHGGNIWWDEQEGRWRDDEIEWAGNTCAPGNERPDGMRHVMPGQTFAMDIKLKFGEAYQNIDPQTINLEPVVIGGVGREVPPQGQIHGAKYWDQDGNGAWDDGEPGLQGWVINLDIDDDGSVDEKTVTDGEGNYWFMNVPEGPFALWEDAQPGWLPTQPPGAAGAPGAYHDFIGRNEVLEGFDFGNQLVAAEIHGVKFHDRNNDGVWDKAAGEEGLPGWVIEIDLDGNGVADRSTTTNRNGEYWFMDLPAGTYELGARASARLGTNLARSRWRLVYSYPHPRYLQRHPRSRRDNTSRLRQLPHGRRDPRPQVQRPERRRCVGRGRAIPARLEHIPGPDERRHGGHVHHDQRVRRLLVHGPSVRALPRVGGEPARLGADQAG